jgi:radical SAM protein with 4Fe4S-binding SPASM domain
MSAFNLFRGRSAIADFPFVISQIELTNRCPFRCVMCPRTNHMTRPQGFMKFPMFQSIVDQTVSAHRFYGQRLENFFWLHHFGESLLHPELGKFLSYAGSIPGLRIGLSVNPLMLTDRIADTILEAGNGMFLLMSLDGHDNESFEKIRGVKNAYDISKENALRFASKKVALGRNIELMFSVIDFPMNLLSREDHRRQTQEFWTSVPGIDHFNWKELCTWNGDAPEIVALKADRDAAAQLREHRCDAKLPSPTPVSCDFPWKSLVFTWNGNVVPCCFDYDEKYVIGNVEQDSILTIWNSPRMRELRREFTSGYVTNSLCSTCEYLRKPYS